MFLTKGFFAYLPDGETDRDELEGVRRTFGNLGYVLHEASHLTGHLGGDAGQPSPGAPFLFFHTTNGAVASPLANAVEPIANPAEALRFGGETLRLYNLVVSGPECFSISSDPLGILGYYRTQLPHGYLICSSVRHLLAIDPELARVDPVAVLEFLCTGTCHGGRTLHGAIKMSRAGEVVRWHRGGSVTINRERRIAIPRANPEASGPVVISRLLEEMKTSATFLAGQEKQAVLPLSGGFDSRLVGCTLQPMNLDLKIYSLGLPRHDEIQVAQRVARLLGNRTTVLGGVEVLDLLPIWLDTAEGQVDSHTLFMSRFLSLGLPEGMPLFHGFIGDTLSGGLMAQLLNKMRQGKSPSLEETTGTDDLVRGLTRHFYGDIDPRIGETLGLDVSIDDISAHIAEELSPEGATAYQRLMLWNLENLQRRLVASQLLFLGRHFRICPLFYYQPLMQVWLSMPLIALEGRNLLRQLYQTAYPRMFTMQHPEEAPLLIPRTWPAMSYTIRLARRAAWMRLRNLMKLSPEPVNRKHYVWTMWHATTESQKKREMERLESTSQDVKSALQWTTSGLNPELWSACARNPRKQSLLLRRFFLIAEYAHSISDPLKQRTPA